MPKRSKIEVEVTYTIVPDIEFNETLNIIKNWYSDEFLKWFNNYLKEKESQLIEG